MMTVEITTICTDCDDECYCYEDAREDFDNCVEPLLDKYRVFRVSGFPVWNGGVSGTVTADTSDELLRALTVNGDFHLTVDVGEDGLECWLAHHDVPMGRKFSVQGIVEE